jgi:DNA-binding LytR/AlgR family response regulator
MEQGYEFYILVSDIDMPDMGGMELGKRIRVWTGNWIADMILEQKRALAEQEGIVFTI